MRYCLPLAGLFALACLMPVGGFAHTITNGPHGGEVEDANPGPTLHIETVVKGTTLTVYLSDLNGNALPTTGVTGKAIVLANEKKDYFDLAPSGTDKLTGTGNFADDPNMKALVTLTVDGATQKALFSQLHVQAQAQ
jgi:hypothetical protein